MTLNRADRDKLIKEALPILDNELAVFVNKYTLYNFMSAEEIEDMRSDCILELFNVVERYNVELGNKLITFISPRIRGFFKDYLRKRKRIKQIEKEKIEQFYEERINDSLSEVVTLNKNQFDIYLRGFDIDLKEIANNIQKTNEKVLEIIRQLPNKKAYIILSYFVFDRSVQNITQDLDLSEKSGWIYKLKNQIIDQIKLKLENKEL